MIEWQIRFRKYDIKVDSFLYDLRIQFEFKGWELRDLTRLIKLVGLKLTYIILYSCIDTTRIRY